MTAEKKSQYDIVEKREKRMGMKKKKNVRMQPPSVVLIHEPFETLLLDELFPLGIEGAHDASKGALHGRCRRKRFIR